MRHWNSRRLLLNFTIVLVVIFSLALVGCDDDDDDEIADVGAGDLAGRTFQFDASFIDPARAGQTATLVFDAEGDDFTLTIDGPPAGPDGDTVITGDVIISTVRLVAQTITVNGVPQDSIIIDGNTVAIGQTLIEFEATVEDLDDGSREYVFTNDDGDELVFEFASGQTGATGGTGSQGD